MNWPPPTGPSHDWPLDTRTCHRYLFVPYELPPLRPDGKVLGWACYMWGLDGVWWVQRRLIWDYAR